jgi:hypothetical protein
MISRPYSFLWRLKQYPSSGSISLALGQLCAGMTCRKLSVATSRVSSLIHPPRWSLEDVLRRKMKASRNTIDTLENFAPRFMISPNERSSMISPWRYEPNGSFRTFAEKTH